MIDAEPKSPSFTKPGSDSKMFPAFTSLPETKHRDEAYFSGRLGGGFSTKFPRKLQPSRVSGVECTPSQTSSTFLVPMDHVVGVQVSQALEGPMGHSCNLHLLKGLLVHWGVREKHQTEGAQGWGWNKLP